MKKEEMTPLNARVPETLMEKLVSAAKANVRSVTGEVTARLQKSFEEDKARS